MKDALFIIVLPTIIVVIAMYMIHQSAIKIRKERYVQIRAVVTDQKILDKLDFCDKLNRKLYQCLAIITKGEMK